MNNDWVEINTSTYGNKYSEYDKRFKYLDHFYIDYKKRQGEINFEEHYFRCSPALNSSDYWEVKAESFKKGKEEIINLIDEYLREIE